MSALLLLLAAAAGADALAECRRLDQLFDTKGMPAPCTAAVDDAANPLADRIDAARLLAFALFADGDVDGAETALLRMLALAPTVALPEGTSPRLAEVFGRAKARFEKEGVVVVAGGPTVAAARVRFDADVVDVFGRAASVRGLLLNGATVVVDVPLLGDGKGRFTGEAALPPGPADGCRIEAVDAGAAVTATGSCVLPAELLAGESDPPWLWIGVGAGAAVVVAAVGIGAFVFASTPPTPATVTVRIE
ncbi:MAG: hypothetical protein Q8O67_26745 [Deltaproteobacteria bacterium]|nr:hypothetical protein [Deltaproteobacteria bacterium]